MKISTILMSAAVLAVSAVPAFAAEENLMRGALEGELGNLAGLNSQMVKNGWQYWNCNFAYDSTEECYSWEDYYWEINGADLDEEELALAKEEYIPVDMTENWPDNVRLQQYPDKTVDEEGNSYGETVALLRWDGGGIAKRWFVYPLKGLQSGLYEFTAMVGDWNNRNDGNSASNCYVKVNGLRVTMQKEVGPQALTYNLEPDEEEASMQAGVPVTYQSDLFQIEDGGGEAPIMHKWSAILGNPADGDTFLCFQGGWSIYLFGEPTLTRIGDYPVGDDAVNEINSNASVVEKAYYGIDGVQVMNPAKGALVIEKSVLDNGSVKVAKKVIR